MASMKVGFHVSIAGGISNAVDNATKIGCTAFQIFSRNPRGWTAKALDPKDVESFKNKLAESKIKQDSVIVHMPYLPNLSGISGQCYEKSVQTLGGEIIRCSTLGISYLVIHLGSHMGQGRNAGISQLVTAINTARKQAKSAERTHPVRILLENSAGQKNRVGSTFADLRLILDALPDSQYGICLDTCHLFASGHDLRTKDSVDETLADFDDSVGFDRLEFVHLNDSKGDLNSGLDRHEHIGLGSIGKTGLAAFLNHSAIKKLPKIMETPIDERRGDEENMRTVLGMVK